MAGKLQAKTSKRRCHKGLTEACHLGTNSDLQLGQLSFLKFKTLYPSHGVKV